MTNTVAFHPIANIFPMLPDDALQELAEDIKKHGLLLPILLFEDKVLDGRNRTRACELVGAEARYENFPAETTDDALNYVLSTNLHRRHLTDQQKYRAIKKAEEIREKAKARLSEAGKIGGQMAGKGRPLDRGPAVSAGPLSDVHKAPHEGEAAFEIAKMLDVSPRKVYQMEQIEREAPEPLRDAVDRGEISVDVASILISDMGKDGLEKVIEEIEPVQLAKTVKSMARKIREKKNQKQNKKKSQRNHVENPFEGIDRVDMMLTRLKQYWQEISPELRAEFLAWVDENVEQYPTQEVLSNGDE